MSVTVTWKTLADGAEHAESFHGFAGSELAERRAYELTQSSGTYHVRVERPDAVPVEVARFGVEDCAGVPPVDDADAEDYGALFDPPDPYQPDPFGAAAAGWDALDCGGVWDGFQVTSDADPGL